MSLDFFSFVLGFAAGGFFVMLVFLREILTAPPARPRRRRDAPIVSNRYAGATAPPIFERAIS